MSPHHQLTLLGGEDGYIEFWDTRVRKCLSRLNMGSEIMRQFAEYGQQPPSLAQEPFRL